MYIMDVSMHSLLWQFSTETTLVSLRLIQFLYPKTHVKAKVVLIQQAQKLYLESSSVCLRVFQ